jgi:hypothetical protein
VTYITVEEAYNMGVIISFDVTIRSENKLDSKTIKQALAIFAEYEIASKANTFRQEKANKYSYSKIEGERAERSMSRFERAQAAIDSLQREGRSFYT